MRLDFNYVIIDDDFEDDDDSIDVRNLINKIDLSLKNKGFNPNHHEYESKSEFERAISADNISTKRIDLYLSDNNLGDDSDDHDNEGIEIYLELKKNFICDFALYTRSNTSEIVKKMASYLVEHQYPGLFSRFTFIPRTPNNERWHDDVLVLLDHIITKREEMNNLRGLFAEKISKIDAHLRTVFASNVNLDDNLKAIINKIPNDRFNKSNIEKNQLDRLRQIRNALLHQDEQYDSVKQEYRIIFELESNKGKVMITEGECSKYRTQLNEVCREILSWS